MKYKRLKMSKPIPVMLDQALLERVNMMSERMGEAKSTVMRIAMRLGLEGLEKTFTEQPVATVQVVESAKAAERQPQLPPAPMQKLPVAVPQKIPSEKKGTR